ncbi:uncharacterized protein OCT59_006040 [Rhizophagus irregularis]|uniref:uncharacterized protein n=1 Tax=Rhizophagus irregularis TaxID=588596 RepID=UPI00332DE54C|nr:hypothetical protein OCT59_006040 [Rhizophagus irregularis]
MNFVFVLHTVFKLPSCKKLQDYCLESICEDPEPFIFSTTFPSLDRDILFGLLKRNDLQIEEIAIWDCLIKWGIEQTPGLKIRPYKAVFPHHIYEEIAEFYYTNTLPSNTILPPRIRKLELLTSTIIKPKLANIISNWIDRNDFATIIDNNRYRYNLIYLMSRDGFNSETFYNRCNGQGPFVILIRVQSKKIYGGYNPIGYAGRDRWLSSAECFVFSFENDQDIFNMKIGRVTNSTYSVYDYCNYDSFFNFGGILFIDEQKLYIGYNNSHYVNIFGGSQSPTIEEIEVFSVIQN